jgi:hypothetical protein
VTEQQKLEALIRQRDEAMVRATNLLEQATAIVVKLSSTPSMPSMADHKAMRELAALHVRIAAAQQIHMVAGTAVQDMLNVQISAILAKVA